MRAPILHLLLSLGLSLGLSAYADPSMHLDLMRLLYRAQDQSQDRMTLQGDLDLTETRFLSWKESLSQEILAAPQAEQPQLLQSYFQELATLTSVRIAMNLPHRAQDLERFFLRFATHPNQPLSTEFAPAPHLIHGSYFQTETEMSGNELVIKPSSEFILGLELGGLSTGHLNAQNLLTFVQYLAVENTLHNLARIKVLRSNHQITSPQIPEALQARLSSLGTGLERQESTDRAVERQWIHTKALTLLQREAAHLHLVNGPSSALSYAQILCATSRESQSCQTAVQDILQEAQTSSELLAQVQFQLYFSPQDPVTAPILAQKLLESLILAKTQLLQTCLAMIINSPLVASLPPGSTDRLFALIEQSSTNLSQRIGQRAPRRWAQEILDEAHNRLDRNAREHFASNLLAAAHELGAHPSRPDPAVLFRVFAEEIAELRINEATLRQVFLPNTSYADARAAYVQAVHNHLSDAVHRPVLTIDGIIEPAHVLIALEQATQRLSLPEGAPRDALGTLIIEHQKQNLTTQIQGLLSLGQLMGFTLSRHLHPQLTRSILLTPAQREKYREMLRLEIETQHPLLNTEITLRLNPSTPAAQMTLAQALVRLHPLRAWTPSSLATLTPAIDRVLQLLEQQNHRWIQNIVNAQTLDEIKPLARSIAVQEILIHSAPALVPVLTEQLETWDRPSFAREWAERQLGPIGHHSFAILCIIDLPLLGAHFFGGAPGRAISKATRLALGPVLKGLLYAGTLAAGMELVQRGIHLRTVSQETEQLRAVQTSTVLDAWAPLLSAHQLQDQEDQLSQEKIQFLGRVLLDGALLIPFVSLEALASIRNLRAQMRGRNAWMESLRDLDAFAALENPTLNLSQIELNIARIRERARSNPTPGTQLRAARAELAYQRLLARQTTHLSTGGL